MTSPASENQDTEIPVTKENKSSLPISVRQIADVGLVTVTAGLTAYTIGADPLQTVGVMAFTAVGGGMSDGEVSGTLSGAACAGGFSIGGALDGPLATIVGTGLGIVFYYGANKGLLKVTDAYGKNAVNNTVRGFALATSVICAATLCYNHSDANDADQTPPPEKSAQALSRNDIEIGTLVNNHTAIERDWKIKPV
jgi:hypothetical protein